MAKKKVKSQTNGQAEPVVEKQKPQTLEQLFGETAITKYKTTDENVYLGELYEMNKAELQHHALKIGVMPIDDTPRLRKILQAEFNKHQVAYKEKPIQKAVIHKISPEVARILAEGK